MASADRDLFEDSQAAGGYSSAAARPAAKSEFGRQRVGSDVSDTSAEFDLLFERMASWPGAAAPVSKLRPPPPAAPRRRPSTLEPQEEVPALVLPACAKRNARSVCSNTSTMDCPENCNGDEIGIFSMEPAAESDDDHDGLDAFMMSPAFDSDDDLNDDHDPPVQFDVVDLGDSKKEWQQPKWSIEPLNEDEQQL
eukprot:TRINITY_DN1559_c0_g3_i1.p1 TRINITY_DN1559_c0_g3~~TRINITY_DN1559_c0_g3_i1.p1  ORF type:complete len:195 (-),score=39.57 TRINITY_DN1559_c0_g3_i1:227-811(-)